MRDLTEINYYRKTLEEIRIYGQVGDSGNGVFVMKSVVDKKPLGIIASSGDGWDHVSVSRTDRVPVWVEMEQVKRTFFRDDETAMQLHVPPSDHISECHNCLHLWRPQKAGIPRPPGWMVG